jgi:hypothetical protein
MVAPLALVLFQHRKKGGLQSSVYSCAVACSVQPATHFRGTWQRPHSHHKCLRSICVLSWDDAQWEVTGPRVRLSRGNRSGCLVIVSQNHQMKQPASLAIKKMESFCHWHVKWSRPNLWPEYFQGIIYPVKTNAWQMECLYFALFFTTNSHQLHSWKLSAEKAGSRPQACFPLASCQASKWWRGITEARRGVRKTLETTKIQRLPQRFRCVYGIQPDPDYFLTHLPVPCGGQSPHCITLACPCSLKSAVSKLQALDMQIMPFPCWPMGLQRGWLTLSCLAGTLSLANH